MKNFKKIFFLISLILPMQLFAKLNVVTTTEDLASLVFSVGGDVVNVSAIAKGYQDPHFVDAKPSYLLKLKKADLFIQIGLELEVGWAPSLLMSARNKKILPGSTGFLDASEGVPILEKPDGVIDRSQGDTHPYGNPHYWLNPSNGVIMAESIAKKLIQLLPQEREKIQLNLDQFKNRLSQHQAKWSEHVSAIKGLDIIAYHNTWTYFNTFTGLNVVNFIEPKPGIPPAPAHIKAVIKQGRDLKIPIIVVDPYFDHKLPQKIANEIGAKLVELAPSVGAKQEIKTYLDLFDHNIQLLIEAVK